MKNGAKTVEEIISWHCENQDVSRMSWSRGKCNGKNTENRDLSLVVQFKIMMTARRSGRGYAKREGGGKHRDTVTDTQVNLMYDCRVKGYQHYDLPDRSYFLVKNHRYSTEAENRQLWVVGCWASIRWGTLEGMKGNESSWMVHEEVLFSITISIFLPFASPGFFLTMPRLFFILVVGATKAKWGTLKSPPTW